MNRNNPDVNFTIKGVKASLLEVIKEQLENDKIIDIVSFDLRSKSSFTSYIIIGTGSSTKHISAAAEKLADKVEEVQGEQLEIHMEGKNKNAQWILIDLDEIIVHLFTQEARQNYNLEEIYSSR